jgi:hypothetical protein
VRPPTAAELVASGVPLDKASKEVERLKTDEARKAETRRVATDARTLARRRLNLTVAAHRDVLVESVRPPVSDLVDKARPFAAVLEEFAPDYPPAVLMRKATPEQVEAFQKADELEARFGAVMAAWRASFKAAANTAGAFDVRDVGAEHRFWANPGAVSNPALNGTALNRRGYPVVPQPTVLTVAREPEEAGFRLAALSEVEAVFTKGRADLVRAERERVRRDLRPGIRSLS